MSTSVEPQPWWISFKRIPGFLKESCEIPVLNNCCISFLSSRIHHAPAAVVYLPLQLSHKPASFQVVSLRMAIDPIDPSAIDPSSFNFAMWKKRVCLKCAGVQKLPAIACQCHLLSRTLHCWMRCCLCYARPGHVCRRFWWNCAFQEIAANKESTFENNMIRFPATKSSGIIA